MDDRFRLTSSSLAASVRPRMTLTEIMVLIGSVVFVLAVLRDPLFLGRGTWSHDVLYWFYPNFNYIADGIQHGHLPLWNPFSRGGEPLFFSYLHLRLLDPVSALVAIVGQVLTSDIGMLEAWDRVLRGLIAGLGTHLLLRQWARHPFTRIILAVLTVLSPIMMIGIRQNGIPDFYYLSPYALMALFRIFEGDNRWRWWWLFILVFATSMQSFFFVGMLISCIFVFVAYFELRPQKFHLVMRSRTTYIRLGLAAAMIGLATVPMLVMALDQGNMHFALRNLPTNWENMVPHGGPIVVDLGVDADDAGRGIVLPYNVIKLTGTFGSFLDVIGTVVPTFLYTSSYGECILFVGPLVLFVAVVGMAAGRHRLKAIWLVLFFGYLLLYLGANAPLHWLLYKVLPPLWLMRHTHLFTDFVILAILYFFMLGFDRLLVSRPFAAVDPKRIASRLMESRGGRYLVIVGMASAIFFVLQTKVDGTWAERVVLAGAGLLALYFALNREFVKRFVNEAGVVFSLVAAALLTYGVVALSGLMPPTAPVAPLYGIIALAGPAVALAMLVWGAVSLAGAVAILVGFTAVAAVLFPGTIGEIAPKTILFGAACLALGYWLLERSPIKALRPITAVAIPAVVFAGVLGYAMVTLHQYPPQPVVQPSHVALGSLVVGCALAVLARGIPAIWLAAALVTGVAGAGYVLLPDHVDYVTRFVLSGALPVAVLLLLRWMRWGGTTALAGVAFVALVATNVSFVLDSSRMWVVQRPEMYLDIHPDQPSFPTSREVVTDISRQPSGSLALALRYAELVTRKAMAFDVPSTFPEKPMSTRLDEVATQPRWSTFFSLHNYAKLVQSGVHPDILEDVFAIGDDLVSFRRRARVTEDFVEETLTMKPSKVEEILHDAVFIDAKTVPAGVTFEDGPCGADATTRIVDSDFDRFTVRAESDSPGFLVVSDAYHWGWQAALDGKPVPIMLANGNFKAVQIPAGTSTVTFTFEAARMRWSIALFWGVALIAALGLVGSLLLGVRRGSLASRSNGGAS